MSLQIGLGFGIFVSSNGEVSWSMWTFHLWTSYHSLFILFIQNWNSIFTPSHLCFHLCSNILDFVDLSFPFFYKNSMMKCGHLEGEEVFGSSKRFADPPLNTNNDSHRLDHVNFSCPWVTIHAVEPNIVNNVHMQQLPSNSSKLLPLVFQSGLELKENIWTLPTQFYNSMFCTIENHGI